VFDLQDKSKENHSMHRTKNTFYLGFILTSLFVIAGTTAHAAGVPQISTQMKAKIQGSMKDYIAKQTVDGKLYVFDAIQNKLLKLTFGKLHSGVAEDGGVYLTCADFTDQNGTKIDLDFMVRPAANNTYITTQTIVHAVDEKYRPYHVGDRNE
jgi:hypothetical protein